MKTIKIILLLIIGMVILVFAIVKMYPSEPAAITGTDPEFNLVIEKVNLDMDGLVVRAKITAENLQEPYDFTCPFKQMILKATSGEVISTIEEADIDTCWVDDDKNFMVVQNFEHDLVFTNGELHNYVLELVYIVGEQDSLAFEVLTSGYSVSKEARVSIKNGIEAKLVSIELLDEYAVIEYCMDLPTTEDWSASLKVGSAPINGGSLTHVGHSDPTTYRCEEVWFYSYQGYDISGKEELTFVIESIRSLAQFDPTPELVAEANLISELQGVSFDSYYGDYTSVIEILSKPEGMSDEEAKQIARDAFSKKTVGQWTFTVPLP